MSSRPIAKGQVCKTATLIKRIAGKHKIAHYTMELPEETTSSVETELKKRPFTDTTENPDENMNADSNRALEVVGKDELGNLKNLKRAKIDRRSRGRTSSIHGSGNSPEIPSNFDKKKVLKKISSQLTRTSSSESRDSSLSNVSGGSGALSSKYNQLQKKYKDLKNIRYTEPERILNSLKEKYEQRESNYKERIETWAARASELKARLQQLEGHGEDYAETNNVEQLKVKIKKLSSRLLKVEKERDDVLSTLNAQSHDFNGSNNSSNSSSSSNVGGLNSLFRNTTSFATQNKLQEVSRKIINMYQTLTSVSINYQENNEAFICEGVDAKTNDIVQFELSVGISEEDSNEMVMSYVPIQNVHSLPEHFHSALG